MIKRWTIHLEFHWGYWPRFYIRPQPKAGERHIDGGLPGVLVNCKECSGVGLLHQPDSLGVPVGPITNAPPWLELDLGPDSLKYELDEEVWTHGRYYEVIAIGHDLDGNPTKLHLQRKDDTPT